PYDQLYVEPPILPERDGEVAVELIRLAQPGYRAVILGHPGAGKSTLVAKLAHDVATDGLPELSGRVPFLVVLRNFIPSFSQGERGLTGYLGAVCRDPYNLDPPADAVEYLLNSGRAVVLLDGLDELGEPALRRRVVQLVEGFVHQYPLVPVVITARRVGYEEASLDQRLFRTSVLGDLDDER